MYDAKMCYIAVTVGVYVPQMNKEIGAKMNGKNAGQDAIHQQQITKEHTEKYLNRAQERRVMDGNEKKKKRYSLRRNVIQYTK